MADAIKLQRKLLWLLVSRVAILVALLVIALVLGPGDREYSQPISVLALVVLALSLRYVIGFKIGISTRTLIPLQLVNDVFLMRGLESRDGKELFVKGRLPFRIDVVNAQPGRTVSFRSMLDRLSDLDVSVSMGK